LEAISSMVWPTRGGNMTGFTNLEASMGAKLMELLKEVAPHTSSVALGAYRTSQALRPEAL
jgi:hypothetical protein